MDRETKDGANLRGIPDALGTPFEGRTREIRVEERFMVFVFPIAREEDGSLVYIFFHDGDMTALFHCEVLERGAGDGLVDSDPPHEPILSAREKVRAARWYRECVNGTAMRDEDQRVDDR